MEEDNKEVQEGDIVDLESDAKRTLEVAKHALVGKIISDKDLNRKTVRGMITKSWGNPRGMYILDLNTNTYLFNFSEPVTPRRIMAEAPWNILGSLLCLHRWTPEFTLHEIDFSYSPFWIQIHGVPLEGISKENARKIASKIGEVEVVEDPFVGYKLARGFMRARVCVDITKPLITGFWIPRKGMPNTWAWIYYEKLQDFCYKCGRLGHGRKDCEEPEAVALWNPDRPRYGPKLGVPPLKELNSVVVGMSYNQGEEGGDYAPGRMWEGERSMGKVVICQSEKADDVTTWKSCEIGKVVAMEKEDRVYQNEEHRQMQNEKMARDEGGNRGKGKEVVSERVQPPTSGKITKGDASGSGPVQGPVSRDDIQLTRVDLQEMKIRPGLGPSSLEALHIEAEDIGLKEKVIILDALSPEKVKTGQYDLGPSHLDMNITTEQIRTAKEKIADRHFGTTSLKIDEGKKEMEMVVWEPRDKAKPAQSATYYVELPEEDDSGEDMQVISPSYGTVGNTLAVSLLESMTLKRGREEEESAPASKEETKDKEVYPRNKGKKVKSGNSPENAVGEGTQKEMESDYSEMAEEAGLPMPHPAP